MPRRLPIGAELVEGGAHFRVWAPSCRTVTLVLEAPTRQQLPLRGEPGGYFALHVPRLPAGTLYRFQLDDDPELAADPASRFQPEGPFGPSQIVDPTAFAWTDRAWPGVAPPERQVLYELHVGTFTPGGTYASAAEHLPFLAELGVTTLELMPIAEWSGTRNWGYDGVNLFSPTHNYGTPDELRAFIDRAHALGLAVILDVVYNHLGPAGNSLFRFGPYRSKLASEWGEGLAFGERGVRELIIANAGYWIDELHFDGLRLDATQAIVDESRPHVIDEIIRRARAAAGTRRILVVAENEPQDSTLLVEHGVDALWNDDFEHTARVAMTGVTDGYFHDYRGTPQELVSAIRHGFLYQGQIYAWQNNPRGSPTRGLTPSRFVHYLENHDQVANLGFGERLDDIARGAMVRALTAVLLLGPQVPLLFQGQEVGTRTPWRYFVDHDRELNEAVRKGRAEFVKQFPRLATPEAQAALPDPASQATFAACILDDAERRRDSPWYRLHRDLIALRTSGGLANRTPDGAVLGTHAFCLRWCDPDYLLLVNLATRFETAVQPEPLLAPPPATGWVIAWSSEHPMYGGHGTPEPFTRARLAIPATSAVLCTPDPAASLRAPVTVP